MIKSYSRNFEASPSFQWSNASQITTGATLTVSWETYNTSSQKYLPFNFTRIVNNSSEDIIFYPQQDSNQSYTIPSGTIITIDKRSIPAIDKFSIKNNGAGNVGAGEIIINNSREGQSTDSIVERLHERLFGKKDQGVV